LETYREVTTGEKRMSDLTRVWEGKKECATKPYFCGQIFDPAKNLWKDVTTEAKTEEAARLDLIEYLQEQGDE
jgi:hypothetical protein